MELMSQIVHLAEILRATITPHAVSRSGEQRQIVRLAGVSNAVRAFHAGALTSELVEVWRVRTADHAGAMLVLEDHHHDVVWWWHGGGLGLLLLGWCGRRLGLLGAAREHRLGLFLNQARRCGIGFLWCRQR